MVGEVFTFVGYKHPHTNTHAHAHLEPVKSRAPIHYYNSTLIQCFVSPFTVLFCHPKCSLSVMQINPVLRSSDKEIYLSAWPEYPFVPANEWPLRALAHWFRAMEPGPQIHSAYQGPVLSSHPLRPSGPTLNQNHLAPLAGRTALALPRSKCGDGWGQESLLPLWDTLELSPAAFLLSCPGVSLPRFCLGTSWCGTF